MKGQGDTQLKGSEVIGQIAGKEGKYSNRLRRERKNGNQGK